MTYPAQHTCKIITDKKGPRRVHQLDLATGKSRLRAQERCGREQHVHAGPRARRRRLPPLRLRSRRGDPIRAATVTVQGQPTRRFRRPNLSIRVDLRGYLPGAVRVTIRVRSEHRRYIRKRVFYAACFTAR